MFESDPNYRQLGAFGRYGQTAPELTFHDGIYYRPHADQFCPFGRIREAPSAQVVDVLWESGPGPSDLQWDNPWIPSASGNHHPQKPHLIREEIRTSFAEKVVPDPNTDLFPPLVHYFPHLISFPVTSPLGYADYLFHWFLYYGTDIGLSENSSDEDYPNSVIEFPYSQAIWETFRETDSLLETDGPDLGQVLLKGWGLFLIGLRPGPGDSTEFYNALGYELTTKALAVNEEADGTNPMLDLRRPSYWKLKWDNLGIPNHHVFLTPFRC
jgi:hypothetical protein